MFPKNLFFKLLLSLTIGYGVCQNFPFMEQPNQGPPNQELPNEPPVRKVNIDAALRKVFGYLTSLVPNLTVEDYMILEKMYAIPPAEALRYRKFITEAIVDEIFKVLTRPFDKDGGEKVQPPVIRNIDVIDRQLGPIERLRR